MARQTRETLTRTKYNVP